MSAKDKPAGYIQVSGSPMAYWTKDGKPIVFDNLQSSVVSDRLHEPEQIDIEELIGEGE